MQRYFLEVAYNGCNYSGFQIQQNAATIQSEVQKALYTLFKKNIELTGSSRTDAGVNALQNFFHFDTDIEITNRNLYNLNAILPNNIVAKNIHKVSNNAHCRFDALTRTYKYFVYTSKNPFLQHSAYFFPFAMQQNLLHNTAQIIAQTTNFSSFSKKHTQVNNFNCNIQHSQWTHENECLVYTVKANRFLRGMVRGLVATQLKVARELISVDDFKNIIAAQDSTKAYFEAPSQGLFLINVEYPTTLL